MVEQTGTGVVAWLRSIPGATVGSVVTVRNPGSDRRTPWRTLVDALDGLVLMVPTLLGAPLLRRLYNRWGTTKGEGAATMPGDELVRDPELTSTRSITIDAEPAEVWRWLVQIGQGRGGLYSYDALENAVGCRIHSTDTVVDELQHLDVGDVVRLGPDGYPAFRVVSVEPARSLVLAGGAPVDRSAAAGGDEGDEGAASTWAWTLTPRGRGRTRLVSRQRVSFPARESLMWHVVEPIGFIMERRMLRGIKERAERTDGASPTRSAPAHLADTETYGDCLANS